MDELGRHAPGPVPTDVLHSCNVVSRAEFEAMRLDERRRALMDRAAFERRLREDAMAREHEAARR